MPLEKKPTSSPINSASYEEILQHFRETPGIDDGLIDRLNIEQMFMLIEGVLPIEACLYYQVLPLFLEGSRLNLGMVSLGDTAATEYVRRIVSYLNYSLVSRKISSEALQISLTAYLRYVDEKSKTKALPEPSVASRRAKRLSDRENAIPEADANNQVTLVVDSPDAINFTNDSENGIPEFSKDWEMDDVSTITISLVDENASSFENVDSTTFVIDRTTSDHLIAEDEMARPFDSEIEQVENLSQDSDISGIPHNSDNVSNLTNQTEDSHTTDDESSPSTCSQNYPVGRAHPITADELSTRNKVQSDENNPTDFITPYQDNDERLSESQEIQPSNWRDQSPACLELDHNVGCEEDDQLHTFSANELVNRLFTQMLDEGIDRLYVERENEGGRILWSESGILRSVVDDLMVDDQSHVIAALKGLTGLSLPLEDKPLQVELERLHKNERLLLRFRFIPTTNGEEAMLQILRGAALRLYRQHELSKLSHDAVVAAQTLQSTLNEIRDPKFAGMDVPEQQADVLLRLTQIVVKIEAQLNEMGRTHPNLFDSYHHNQ